MPFDPTLPATGSPIISAELRNQFYGLKGLIDAQAAQIAVQQAQINILRGVLPAPVLDHDMDPDADRLTLSKTLLPDAPDEWLGWSSTTGNGNPDTNPSEWNGPLGWDEDNSNDENWVIEWDGFENNHYFIAAYRVGTNRSPYSNIVHP